MRQPALVAASLAALVLAACAPAPALARRTGGYVGGSRPGVRHLHIELRIGRHGRAAWRIDYGTPCVPQDVDNRTIGTDVQPPEPRLRVAHGRFALRHHVVVETNDLDERYVLRGAFHGRRLVGRFRAVVHQYGDTCDTGWLRWHARRGRPIEL